MQAQIALEIENSGQEDDFEIFSGFQQANEGTILSKMDAIPDWRALNIGFFAALRQGKLLRTDIKILQSRKKKKFLEISKKKK